MHLALSLKYLEAVVCSIFKIYRNERFFPILSLRCVLNHAFLKVLQFLRINGRSYKKGSRSKTSVCCVTNFSHFIDSCMDYCGSVSIYCLFNKLKLILANNMQLAIRFILLFKL